MQLSASTPCTLTWLGSSRAALSRNEAGEALKPSANRSETFSRSVAGEEARAVAACADEGACFLIWVSIPLTAVDGNGLMSENVSGSRSVEGASRPRAHYFEPCKGGPRMKVWEQILNSIVYIGGLIDGEPAPDNFHIAGTGFFIANHAEPDLARKFYIVTAKHVIQDLKGLPVAIRINTKQNQAEIVPVPKDVPLFCHIDQSVDVAIIRWRPNPERYYWNALGSQTFLNEKWEAEVKVAGHPTVGIGDEVFSIGLFSPFVGKSRNVPLVRIGHMAMMADEPIVSTDFGPMKVHLVEAHSMKGLSGAPVYVRRTVSIRLNPNHGRDEEARDLSGAGDDLLLGVMHGQWEIPARQRKQIDPNAILHSAISAVVPASRILEIINQPMTMKQKQKPSGGLKPTSLSPAKRKRKNRDIPVPSADKLRFFSDLEKATRKLKPSDV
jgi:hypothetical protein